MIRALYYTLKIDIAYSVNSFIYALKHLPIFKDLLTDDAYSSKLLKKLVSIIGIIFSLGRALFLKFMYFFFLFIISYKLFPNALVKSFYHIYFVLTVLGLFINNKLLNTSKKKYFGIILFNIDATKFFRANILWNTLGNLILNSFFLLLFGYLLKCPFHISLLLIIYSLFTRYIGEALNILFYKKYKYIWYSNTSLYFTILIILLGMCVLPYLNVFITFKVMFITTILFVALGVISLIYLITIKDYKLIYKKLSQITNVMDSKNEKDYLKQAMVEVNKKDKEIDLKKLQGKKGYDLFNTIFFERHKEILLRSAKKYSAILAIIYIVISYLVIHEETYQHSVSNFLNNNLGWFVIIMFFINRGAIITQAMFFNCDHAMLRYNFYRESKTILELFKKRLATVIKVNLLPAMIIAVGNTILLILSGAYNLKNCLAAFSFIILLSIFFSVHYLVIYYLLQPFNREMEVKKVSYSFVTMGTYLISYMLTDLILDSFILSTIGLTFTISYIIIALILVNKLAPRTFKLNWNLTKLRIWSKINSLITRFEVN